MLIYDTNYEVHLYYNIISLLSCIKSNDTHLSTLRTANMYNTHRTKLSQQRIQIRKHPHIIQKTKILDGT